ncbi:MAG: nucleoside triphosphate pyrophosphohydrolase [Granulosicoccus sp.]
MDLWRNLVPAIDRLLDVMRRLRDPENGCPWDIQQTFATIAPYTIEEAYEVADAIERNDLDDLKDELGDLLLQVVFHAQMASEQSVFNFDDVAQAIIDKMIRRHPHVFTDAKFTGMSDFKVSWEASKTAERAAKRKRAVAANIAELKVVGVANENVLAVTEGTPLQLNKQLADATSIAALGAMAQEALPDHQMGSALDGIALNLPALLRAEKLQKRAASVGFDWPEGEPVWDKLDEEVAEVQAAEADADEDGMEDEFGDLLFTVVNLIRRRGLDAEVALRRANKKFERRFRRVEIIAQTQQQAMDSLSIEELDRLWILAKNESR